jgi:hypothetical protein
MHSKYIFAASLAFWIFHRIPMQVIIPSTQVLYTHNAQHNLAAVTKKKYAYNMPETDVTYQLLSTLPDIKWLQTNITATQKDRIFVEFIPLWYSISKLTYILLPPTTQFYFFYQYMLHVASCRPSSGIEIYNFKTQNEITYIF